MAKHWVNVRLEAGLMEDLQCEMGRLLDAQQGGHDVRVQFSTSNRHAGEVTISVSDFVRRLLDDYQRARQRKRKHKAKGRAKRVE
jgi:hypothetical protein